MTSSVRPPPPPPAMTIEAASGDTELDAYCEVLAEIDSLHGVLSSKLSALASLVVDVRSDARTMHPVVCLRTGYLLRDRLHSALQTPGTVPEVGPSPDLMLLKAIRTAYRWAVEGVQRACRLAEAAALATADQSTSAEAVLGGLAEVATVFSGAGEVSDAVAAVVEAVRVFGASIERLGAAKTATKSPDQ